MGHKCSTQETPCISRSPNFQYEKLSVSYTAQMFKTRNSLYLTEPKCSIQETPCISWIQNVLHNKLPVSQGNQMLNTRNSLYLVESNIQYRDRSKPPINGGLLRSRYWFRVKVKGKGRLWVLQHCCLEAYCTLTRMSSFIHLQRRCTHQAALQTSASEGRNYICNLASNP